MEDKSGGGYTEPTLGKPRNSYWAFLNISEVYDSMLKEGLWHKIGSMEKRKSLCGYIKDYSGVETRVVLNGGSQSSLQ